jgi:hypothetical protein
MMPSDRTVKPFRVPFYFLAAIAAAAGAGCRPLPGPPPTPPGASAAFDAHLADLDARYRFLFSDASRIYEAAFTRPGETVLLDVAQAAQESDVAISGNLRLSPDGRWLLVPHWVTDTTDAAREGDRRLLLFDVHAGAARRVPIPPDRDFTLDAMSANDELCDWIAPDRFVVSLSHYPDGGGVSKKYLAYDLEDLTTPRAMDLDSVAPLLDRSSEPPSGPRRATLHAYHHAEPLFDAERNWVRWDIRLDGQLARRSFTPAGPPGWNEAMKLYVWHERMADPGETLVMDEAGHYRAWHAGKWFGTLPR